MFPTEDVYNNISVVQRQVACKVLQLNHRLVLCCVVLESIAYTNCGLLPLWACCGKSKAAAS